MAETGESKNLEIRHEHVHTEVLLECTAGVRVDRGSLDPVSRLSAGNANDYPGRIELFPFRFE